MEGPSPRLVLIADDFGRAARSLAEVIELAAAYSTVTALDGLDAFELGKKYRPDVAILDIDLPRMGGIESAQALRAALGEDRPFLIGMTGGADFAAAALSGAFDHVFQKPVDIDKLLDLIKAA
jgi:CheY-like chemotaxis protein